MMMTVFYYLISLDIEFYD